MSFFHLSTIHMPHNATKNTDAFIHCIAKGIANLTAPTPTQFFNGVWHFFALNLASWDFRLTISKFSSLSPLVSHIIWNIISCPFSQLSLKYKDQTFDRNEVIATIMKCTVCQPSSFNVAENMRVDVCGALTHNVNKHYCMSGLYDDARQNSDIDVKHLHWGRRRTTPRGLVAISYLNLTWNCNFKVNYERVPIRIYFSVACNMHERLRGEYVKVWLRRKRR